MRKENLLWAILMCGMALSSCTDRLQEAASISLNPKIKSETGFKASLNLENSFISTRSTEPNQFIQTIMEEDIYLIMMNL